MCSGAGRIPAGTYVTSVAGNGNGPTVTLSNNFTGSGIANGASIVFTGTGSLSAASGIVLYSTRECIVSKNQLSGVAQYGYTWTGPVRISRRSAAISGKTSAAATGLAALSR